MSFATAELVGTPLTFCRTGYTGERGYELVIPAEAATAVWDAVTAAGEPYGLQPPVPQARDTLRTEMGYALHGHELSPTITPVQARLGWAMGWTKETFFGHEALRTEKQVGPTRLRGLKAGRAGDSGPGMVVRDPEGNELGAVTSGTFSPTSRPGIALALVDAHVALDDMVTVDVRSRAEPFVASSRRSSLPGYASRDALDLEHAGALGGQRRGDPAPGPVPKVGGQVIDGEPVDRGGLVVAHCGRPASVAAAEGHRDELAPVAVAERHLRLGHQQRQPLDVDPDAGLLGHLPGQGGGRLLARLDDPGRETPLPAVAAPVQQDVRLPSSSTRRTTADTPGSSSRPRAYRAAQVEHIVRGRSTALRIG